MTEYFKKFDIENNEEYKSSPIVLERTSPLAQRIDFELGYWMQAFSRLFSPGVYFRACNAFGKLENWQELRYLMEHAVFDPEHPLYGLDYETCSADDRMRLDVFREIARSCCYCGYAILKRERPNLLPKSERKPLTKKEEKTIRCMVTYYTNGGTWQERDAFEHYKWYFHEINPHQKPTIEETEAFEKYEAEIQRQLKLKRKEETKRLEAERLSKLPEVTYIAAHPFIKDQFRQVFGKGNKFTVIRHRFESGDLKYRGKLPATQELVVLLTHDVRSLLLLLYIAAHFQQKISVVDIVGSDGRRYPFVFNNLELRECCKRKIELSEAQISQLKNEFRQLKTDSSEFFKLEGSQICRLPRKEVYNHILRQFPGEEIPLLYLLGKCLGYAPEGWPKSDVFYFCCIDELIEDGVIILSDQSDPYPYDYKHFPPKWIIKLAEKYLTSKIIDHDIRRIY